MRVTRLCGKFKGREEGRNDKKKRKQGGGGELTAERGCEQRKDYRVEEVWEDKWINIKRDWRKEGVLKKEGREGGVKQGTRLKYVRIRRKIRIIGNGKKDGTMIKRKTHEKKMEQAGVKQL